MEACWDGICTEPIGIAETLKVFGLPIADPDVDGAGAPVDAAVGTFGRTGVPLAGKSSAGRRCPKNSEAVGVGVPATSLLSDGAGGRGMSWSCGPACTVLSDAVRSCDETIAKRSERDAEWYSTACRLLGGGLYWLASMLQVLKKWKHQRRS